MILHGVIGVYNLGHLFDAFKLPNYWGYRKNNNLVKDKFFGLREMCTVIWRLNSAKKQ